MEYSVDIEKLNEVYFYCENDSDTHEMIDFLNSIGIVWGDGEPLDKYDMIYSNRTNIIDHAKGFGIAECCSGEYRLYYTTVESAMLTWCDYCYMYGINARKRPNVSLMDYLMEDE